MWTLPKTFYEATVTLILRPEKHTTKKENYRLISLNIDFQQNISEPDLATLKKDHIPQPSLIYPKFTRMGHKSMNVIQHITKRKDKSYMIISIDSEKTFYKIQYPFIIKTLMKVSIEGTYEHNKSYLWQTYIQYNTQWWKAEHLLTKIWIKARCSLTTLIFNMVLEMIR